MTKTTVSMRTGRRARRPLGVLWTRLVTDYSIHPGRTETATTSEEGELRHG